MKSVTAKRTNPYNGGSFDDFLKDEGIFEEVHAKAVLRAFAERDAVEQDKAGAQRSHHQQLHKAT